MTADQIKTYFEKYRQAKTEEEKTALWAELRQLTLSESVEQRKEGMKQILKRLDEIKAKLTNETVH